MSKPLQVDLKDFKEKLNIFVQNLNEEDLIDFSINYSNCNETKKNKLMIGMKLEVEKDFYKHVEND